MKVLLEADETRSRSGRRRRPRPRLHRRAHDRASRRWRPTSTRTRWDDIERGSGLARAEIEAGGRRLLRGRSASILCYGMGITQHRTAPRTCSSSPTCCCCAAISAGQGAGICPVRGHSNVQGDRTVGINEKPTEAFLDRLERRVRLRAAARARPQCRSRRVEAMVDGTVKALHRPGRQLRRRHARPGGLTSAAMRKLDLTVHIVDQAQPQPSRDRGATALILPCLGRTEIDDAGERAAVGDRRGLDVDGACLARQPEAGLGACCAPSRRSSRAWRARRCRTAPGRLGGLGRRLRPHPRRDRGGVPGFEDYNARVREPGGFHLPIAASERDGRRRRQGAISWSCRRSARMTGSTSTTRCA